MGRAAAELFAREGAVVAGCELKEEGARETVERVRRAGGTMTSTQPLDLGEEDAVKDWIDGAARAQGGIDRRPLQQRGSHALRSHRRRVLRGLALHPAQRARRRLPPLQARLTPPTLPRRRERHKRRLHGWAHGFVNARPGHAYGVQGRRHSTDSAAGRRGGALRHPGQLHQPRHDPLPGYQRTHLREP